MVSKPVGWSTKNATPGMPHGVDGHSSYDLMLTHPHSIPGRPLELSDNGQKSCDQKMRDPHRDQTR